MTCCSRGDKLGQAEAGVPGRPPALPSCYPQGWFRHAVPALALDLQAERVALDKLSQDLAASNAQLDRRGPAAALSAPAPCATGALHPPAGRPTLPASCTLYRLPTHRCAPPAAGGSPTTSTWPRRQTTPASWTLMQPSQVGQRCWPALQPVLDSLQHAPCCASGLVPTR